MVGTRMFLKGSRVRVLFCFCFCFLQCLLALSLSLLSPPPTLLPFTHTRTFPYPNPMTFSLLIPPPLPSGESFIPTADAEALRIPAEDVDLPHVSYYVNGAPPPNTYNRSGGGGGGHVGTVPCKWFAMGTCRRGDSCTFLHDANAAPSPSPSSSSSSFPPHHHLNQQQSHHASSSPSPAATYGAYPDPSHASLPPATSTAGIHPDRLAHFQSSDPNGLKRTKMGP